MLLTCQLSNSVHALQPNQVPERQLYFVVRMRKRFEYVFSWRSSHSAYLLLGRCIPQCIILIISSKHIATVC